MSEFSHGEFVEGYRAGTLKVHVDRKSAAAFVSGRMLLPFILLPLFGVAVAVALAGHFIAGGALFAFALLFRAFVRSSSHGFVLVRAINHAGFYRDAVAAGVIRLEETGEP